jgi:FlaA1/EpsC-like NDP-sugar epimerase
MDNLAAYYRDKVTLVTGAAGTIGSQIVARLSSFGSTAVRALDNDETRLFVLERVVKSPNIRVFVGDIRDKDRLERAFEGVDIVFHGAALKHVPLCEYNPFEAAKTNVIGTQNVIEAALDKEVKKVVLISTDKAVNPTNVMGATKLVAERLFVSANHYKGKRPTSFSCVRFGNVLDSRGSVLPIFKEQITRGGPVTITNRRMTRFVMRISDAAELILQAGAASQGGEIYILKMNALSIIDLAEALVEVQAMKSGYSPGDIELTETGKRKGEKMHEELMTKDEAQCVVDAGPYFVLNSSDNTAKILHKASYSSKQQKKLTKDEIKQLYL